MHTGLPKALKSPAGEKSFYFKFSLTSHLSILFGNESLLPEPPQHPPPHAQHTLTRNVLLISFGVGLTETYFGKLSFHLVLLPSVLFPSGHIKGPASGAFKVFFHLLLTN